jgi:hypothetical protein
LSCRLFDQNSLILVTHMQGAQFGTKYLDKKKQKNIYT